MLFWYDAKFYRSMMKEKMIMPHNALFHFIKTHRDETMRVLDAIASVVEDVDRHGASYFRFELPAIDTTPLHNDKHTYTLRDHHLSVYQTEHSHIAELSQYHYTARYLDEAGSLYQLHVYFNADDEMVKGPVFSKIISGAGGSDVVPVPADVLNGFFMSAAKTHSKAIIGSIRTKLNLTIDEYAAIYEHLEFEAFELSKSMKTDLERYLRKLQEMSAILQCIAPLVAHGHYTSTDQFLQKMIAAIGKQVALRSAEGAAGAGGGALEETEATTVVNHTCLTISAHETSKKIIELVVLDERIYELANTYASVNKEDHALLASVIGNILRAINELLLDESNTTISIDALATLHKLYREVEQEGEKLFQALLHSGNTSALGELSAFYHLINEKHLAFALQTANVNLLDCLLTHGHFSINEQTVTVDAVTYPTAVHFCYEMSSAARPLVDCLAVLLKHNASIMHADRHGLPMAYRILSADAHPLEGALDVSGLLDSILFYKRLVAELELYLKTTSLSAKERKEIQQHISNYNRYCSLGADEGFRTKAKAVSLPLTPLKRTFEAVFNDPDVVKLCAAHEITYNSFLAKATKKQKRRSIRHSKENLEELGAMFKDLDPRFLTFEILKCLMLTRIRTMIELLEWHIKLYELPTARHPAAVEAYNREAKVISKNIKRLEKELAPPEAEAATGETEGDVKTPETAGKGLEKAGLFARTKLPVTRAVLPPAAGVGGAGRP